MNLLLVVHEFIVLLSIIKLDCLRIQADQFLQLSQAKCSIINFKLQFQYLLSEFSRQFEVLSLVARNGVLLPSPLLLLDLRIVFNLLLGQGVDVDDGWL